MMPAVSMVALLLFASMIEVTSFAGPRLFSSSSRRLPSALFETVNESKEVLKSLIDFHAGTWGGVATSFSVTNDVMAGIVGRKTSEEYEVSVKIGLIIENTDYSLSETYEWGDKMSTRKLSLIDSSLDADAVDGSYSLDTALPNLPVDLIGTPKLIHFGIEHCVAVNDNARIRCFAFYGIDQSLVRVVVCDEKRVAEAPNAFGEETKSESESANSNDNQKLSPRPMSLLEMTSGVWLGDVMVRQPTSNMAGKGFAPEVKKKQKQKKEFAKWSIGLQKATYEYIWDLNNSIQKVINTGKSLGESMTPEQSASLSGTVCLQESLRTEIPKDQRMCYFDWMAGNQAGFLLGNVAMQFPRYLTFDDVPSRRSMFTEVGVFQCVDDGSIDVTDAGSLPVVVCSTIGRCYDSHGGLKSGSTGFFEFKRSEESESPM